MDGTHAGHQQPKHGGDQAASSAPPPVAEARQAGSSGLPVLPPPAAVLEILVLVVLPGLLDYAFTGFPSLNETQPHFFWLPVLLLSVQYGTVSGLLAAGAAIALSALLGWPEQEIGENHFSYLLRIGLQPVLWLTTAVILGQFRLRQIERKEALTRAVEELTQQRHAIADHARNLRSRCEQLERLIAVRREPRARELLSALGRMHTGSGLLDGDDFNHLASLAFGDCQLSVWLRDSDGLSLAHRHGAAAGGALPEHIGIGEPVAAAVIESGRRLCVLTPGDEPDLAGAGLAAVPITLASGEIAGLLLLERADAGELDEATPWRLTALARALADRLAKSQSVTARPAARPVLSAAVEPSPGLRLWRRVKWQRGGRRARGSSARTG